MASRTFNVGVIGCGNISDTYFGNAALFAGIRLAACADLDAAAARDKAARYGVPALSPQALLADPAIDIVLNLTSPAAHAEVGRAALAAGKHLYGEKPLCTRADDGQALLEQARAAGLRVGCAPDTVLGAAHQRARRLVDGGALGRIVAGSAAVMDRGMEAWHPAPAFFFRPGGGPVLDMGPYYLTSLVSLLGPAARVTAFGATGLAQRSVGSGPLQGTAFAVEVATTVQAVIEFAAGAIVTLAASWDVWRHRQPPIELHGTEGSLVLPDPNWFGGELAFSERGGPWQAVPTAADALGRPNRDDGAERVADYRIVGLVDLAHAIAEDRPARADGALAMHVLEIMEAIDRAAAGGHPVAVHTRTERPAPLGDAEVAAWRAP